MKSYYSDYAAHCVRLYFNYSYDNLINDISRTNWLAVSKAFEKLEEEEIQLAREYYVDVTKPRPLMVSEVASNNNIEERILWTLLRKIEKMVATNRELI